MDPAAGQLDIMSDPMPVCDELRAAQAAKLEISRRRLRLWQEGKENLWALLWRQHYEDRMVLDFAYSLLFLFAAGLAIALGRINYGWLEASESRYRTPSLLFLSRRKSARLKILGPALVAAAVLAEIVLPVQAFYIALATARTRDVNVPGLSLAVGALDPAAWGRLDSGPKRISGLLPYLKANRLSIFSEPDVEKIGKPLSSFLRIADARGTVVGLAYGFRPAGEFFAAPDDLRGKWGGYAIFKPGTSRLFAYAAMPGGQVACPLGTLGVKSGVPR